MLTISTISQYPKISSIEEFKNLCKKRDSSYELLMLRMSRDLSKVGKKLSETCETIIRSVFSRIQKAKLTVMKLTSSQLVYPLSSGVNPLSFSFFRVCSSSFTVYIAHEHPSTLRKWARTTLTSTSWLCAVLNDHCVRSDGWKETERGD